MSFEIYLQCFEQGKPSGVPLSSVRALFPVVEGESEPDYWKVWYDEFDWCNISVTPLSTDSALAESLCAYHPCGDMRFWKAILAVMRLGPVVVYFPGNAPPIVASELAAQQLPRDMVEAMGHEPRIVQSVEEILEIMHNA